MAKVEISMEEMVMDAFRLMRTGNYLTVKSLMKAFKEMYPEATDEQEQQVLVRLRKIAEKQM